ncbi:MAG TPA: aldehyde dehydrogenase family protein [Gemmatimonadaceae bacterium]|nr:aldehyde dehydrogenase family protein [Gemmatimonadaceae bacterium]
MAHSAPASSATPATPTASRAVESRDPATGEVWSRHDAASSSDVAAALAAARGAQRAWRARPVHERARTLERFRRALFARRDEVATTIGRENGKPPVEALSEVLVTLDFARYYRSRRVMRELRPSARTGAGPAMWRKRVLISEEPFGVIGVISPWNYPFMLPAAIVLPALVSGNAVLLKPSEFTTESGLLIASLLSEAGLPPGVFQVLPGAGATGAALIEQGCDKLFFTGSEATGRKVAAASGARLVPCVLELGGSDAALVLDDADLALAAEGLAWGRFSNSGQTCVAPKRLFVHAAVYDRFAALLAARVRRINASTDRASAEMGPLIRPQQTALIQAQFDDAIARGATVAAAAGAAPGVFAPVLLTDVTPDMRVLREETFGPVLPMMRVRDDDDAVGRANDSPYGLSASVWSRDRRRALAVAARLDVGSVVLNDSVVVAGMSDVPHGGVKASGSGRAHGIAGLRECVRSKTVVVERAPGLRQVWWFPYGPALRGAFDGAIAALHGPGLLARVRGVWRARVLLRPPRAPRP